MRCDTLLSLYALVHILDPSIPLVTYILNGWPISQTKDNKNIRISYSLKYRHSKKKDSLRKGKW